ncbi:uncharacterized protein TNIN_76851 [Trichonephila inaurata madagascariensis]|uniref:VWFC domain-containing protein n=1 Tax=Trichonephila inaurata madagascariensis TaxID=2747483 RepID=A0A8X6MAV2_9ARAC|nr:uncharacterized protein TNIN_76851 [Trichonephila inaurata madagascariensis]
MFLFESRILFAGCYYLSDHYDNGERIDTNEPCLNCTCLNSMLMCYLRICPFVKPVGEECIVEREEGDCCPKIWCPEVIKVKDNSPNTNEKRKQQQPGCYLGDQYYPDGAQLPHDPKRPCEVCYCIRNSTACVMQECELKVDGCFPIYKEGQCCPCRYNCTYEEATPTPPGVTLTELAEGCTLPDGSFVEDGEAVNSTNPCEHCYCMRNEVVCAIQECQAPGDNCRPVPPKPDQCCPDRYECLVNSISPNGFEKPVSLTFSTLFTTSPGTTASVDISGNIKGKITEGSRIKGAPKKEIVDEIPSPIYKPPTQTKTTESPTEESNTKSSAEISSPVYIFADQTTPSEFYEDVLSTELSSEIHSILHIPTDQSKLSESSTEESNTELPIETLSPVNLSLDQTKTNETSIEESSSLLPTVTQRSPTTSVPYSQENSTSEAFSTAVPSHELAEEDKLEFGGDAKNVSSDEYSTPSSARIPTLSVKTSSSDITTPHTELTTITSEITSTLDVKTTLNSHSDAISSDVSTHQHEFSTATPAKDPILDAEATLSSLSPDISADVTAPQIDLSSPTEIKFKETGSSKTNHTKTNYGVDESSFDIVPSTSLSTIVSQEVNAENYSTQRSPGPLYDEITPYVESSSETPKENEATTEKVSHTPPNFVRIKGQKPTVQTTTEVSVKMSSTESSTAHELTLNETSFDDTKVIEETGVKNAQKKEPYQHTKGKRPQIKQKPLLPVGVIPGESKLSGNLPISSTKRRPILVSVPGEGNCHLGKTSYKHGQDVPSTDVCKMSCQCSRGKIYCVEIKCEILHPENFANCQIVQNKSECCPHYECGSEVTKSIETIEVTVVDESTIAPSKDINVPKDTYTSTVTSNITDGTTVTDNSFKVYTTTRAAFETTTVGLTRPSDIDETSHGVTTTETNDLKKYTTSASTTQAPFSIYDTQLGQTTTGYETSTSSGKTEFPTEEKIPDSIHKKESSTEISHLSEAFEVTTEGVTKPSDINETSHGVTTTEANDSKKYVTAANETSHGVTTTETNDLKKYTTSASTTQAPFSIYDTQLGQTTTGYETSTSSGKTEFPNEEKIPDSIHKKEFSTEISHSSEAFETTTVGVTKPSDIDETSHGVTTTETNDSKKYATAASTTQAPFSIYVTQFDQTTTGYETSTSRGKTEFPTEEKIPDPIHKKESSTEISHLSEAFEVTTEGVTKPSDINETSHGVTTTEANDSKKYVTAATFETTTVGVTKPSDIDETSHGVTAGTEISYTTFEEKYPSTLSSVTSVIPDKDASQIITTETPIKISISDSSEADLTDETFSDTDDASTLTTTEADKFLLNSSTTIDVNEETHTTFDDLEVKKITDTSTIAEVTSSLPLTTERLTEDLTTHVIFDGEEIKSPPVSEQTTISGETAKEISTDLIGMTTDKSVTEEVSSEAGINEKIYTVHTNVETGSDHGNDTLIGKETHVESSFISTKAPLTFSLTTEQAGEFKTHETTTIPSHESTFTSSFGETTVKASTDFHSGTSLPDEFSFQTTLQEVSSTQSSKVDSGSTTKYQPDVVKTMVVEGQDVKETSLSTDAEEYFTENKSSGSVTQTTLISKVSTTVLEIGTTPSSDSVNAFIGSETSSPPTVIPTTLTNKNIVDETKAESDEERDVSKYTTEKTTSISGETTSTKYEVTEISSSSPTAVPQTDKGQYSTVVVTADVFFESSQPDSTKEHVTILPSTQTSLQETTSELDAATESSIFHQTEFFSTTPKVPEHSETGYSFPDTTKTPTATEKIDTSSPEQSSKDAGTATETTSLLTETSSKQPATEYPSTSESATDTSVGHEKINYPDENETSLDVNETSHHLEKNTSFIQDSKHQSPENVISTTSSTFITTVDNSVQVSEETKASTIGYDTTEISFVDQKSFTTASVLERVTTATPTSVSQDSISSSVSEEFKHDGAISVSEENVLEHSDDEEGTIEAFTYPPKQTEKPESHIKFEEPHKIPTEKGTEEIATEIDSETTVFQKHSTEALESSTTKTTHDEEFYSTTTESKVPEYSSETDKLESDFTTVSNENIVTTTFYSATSTQPPKSEFVTHVSEIQDTFETSGLDKKPEQVATVKAEDPKVEQEELKLISPSVEKEQSTIVTDVPQTISFGESHSHTSSSIETSTYFSQSSTEFIKHEISTFTTSSPVKESWISTLSDEKDNPDITTNNNNNNEIGGISEFNKTTTSSFRPEDTEHFTIQAEEDPHKTEFASDEVTVSSEITKLNDFEAAGSTEKTSEGDSSSVVPENKVTDVKTTAEFVTTKEDKYTKTDETTKEHDVSSTFNPVYAETEKAHEFSTLPSSSRPEIVTSVPTSSTGSEYDDTLIENVNKHSTSFIEQSEETDESFGGSTVHSLSSKVTSEFELKQTTTISSALLDNEESESSTKEDSNFKFTIVQGIIHTTDALNKKEFSDSSTIVSDPTKKYDASYVTNEYSDDIATGSANVKYTTLPPFSTVSETEEKVDAKTTTEKYEVHVSTISEDSDSKTTTSSPIDFKVTTSVSKEIKTTLSELNSDIKANDMISDSDKTLSTSTVSPDITQNLQQKTETSTYHSDSEISTEKQSSDHITAVTDPIILIKDKTQETFSDVQDHTSDNDVKVTSQQTILVDSEVTETIAPSEIEKVSDDVKYETKSTDSSENIRTQDYGFHKQTYPPEITKKELAESTKDYDSTKLTNIVTTNKALSVSESTTAVFTEHPLLLTKIQDEINTVSSDVHGLKEADANATEKSIRPNIVSVTTSSPIFIPENLLGTSKVSFEEESSSNEDVFETKSPEPDVITEVGSKFPTTLSISTNNNDISDVTEQTFKNEMPDQTSTSFSFEDKETVSVDTELPTAITPQRTDTETASIGSFNSAITQDYGFHKEVYSPPKHETTTQFVELFDTTKSLVSFETSIDDSLAQTTQKIGSDTYSDISTSITDGTHYQSDKESTTDLISTSTTHHITTMSKESTTHHVTTPIDELTSKLTDISTENPLASITHSKHASSTFSTSNTAIDLTTAAPVTVSISDVDEKEIIGKGRPHAETTITSYDASTSAPHVDIFTKDHTETKTAQTEKITEDHDYENNSNIFFHSTMSGETSETDKFVSELNTKKNTEQDYLYTTYITHSPSAENSFKDFTATPHTKLDENYSENSLTEQSPLATPDEDKDAFETISDKNVSITNLEDVTIPTKSSSEYEYLLTTNETNIDAFSAATISELSKPSTKKPQEISVMGSHIEETFVTDIDAVEKNIYNDSVTSTFSPDQTQYISSHTESTIDNTKLPQDISHVDLSTVLDLHTEFSFKDGVSDYRGTTIPDDIGLSTVSQPLVTEQIEQFVSFTHQRNESYDVTESFELKNDTETSFDFSSVTPSVILDVSKTSSVDSVPDIISSTSLPSIDSDAPQSTNSEGNQSEGTEKILDLHAFTITEGSTHSSTPKSISSTTKEIDSWRISEEDKSVTLKPFTHDTYLGITEKQNNLENETANSSDLPSTFSEHSAPFTTIYPPTDISTAISDGITVSATEKDSSLSHKDMLETIASYFPDSSPPSILHETHKPSSTTTSVPVHKHTTAKPEVETQHNFPEDGYCLYENQVFNSAEQIPRKDPCEFCFCFRGDIICLQQSCPPPIRGCYATPIDGFCCPRFHCPVQEMHFNLSTTTTTTADPRMGKYLPPSDQNTGCEIEGNVYRVHQVVRPSSGPCMLCRCELGGIMKCDPRDCQPQAPLLLRLNKDFFRKR